jgi:hypothetical protein
MNHTPPGSARKPPLTILVELVIVGLICGLLSCCLWPIVRDSRGPAGDPIPRQPPDEANRVRLPGGFSIIVPPNWASHTYQTFMMAPLSPGRYARRSKALVLISYLGRKRPPGLEGLRRTTFLAQEAYERMRVVRSWTFDDGAWSEYTLYFRHDEDWYEVKYGIAEERTSLPGMVRQYINTLHWDARPSSEAPGPVRLVPEK